MTVELETEIDKYLLNENLEHPFSSSNALMVSIKNFLSSLSGAL